MSDNLTAAELAAFRRHLEDIDAAYASGAAHYDKAAIVRILAGDDSDDPEIVLVRRAARNYWEKP
jgi:hypothetical protein